MQFFTLFLPLAFGSIIQFKYLTAEDEKTELFLKGSDCSSGILLIESSDLSEYKEYFENASTRYAFSYGDTSSDFNCKYYSKELADDTLTRGTRDLLEKAIAEGRLVTVASPVALYKRQSNDTSGGDFKIITGKLFLENAIFSEAVYACLLAALVFIIIMACGLCCLCDIQSVDQFQKAEREKTE